MTFYLFFFSGAVYADNARFDRCLDLWMHALKLRQKNHISVVKDLLRFAQVFSQMLHVGITLEQHYVTDVFASAITELERNKKKLEKTAPKFDPEVMVGVETHLILANTNDLANEIVTHFVYLKAVIKWIIIITKFTIFSDLLTIIFGRKKGQSTNGILNYLERISTLISSYI